jgi:hypothetical protein
VHWIHSTEIGFWWHIAASIPTATSKKAKETERVNICIYSLSSVV